MSGAGDLTATRRDRLRALPAVDELLRGVAGGAELPRARLVDAVRRVLAEGRRAVLAADTPAALAAVPLDPDTLHAAVRAHLAAEAAWRLERVVNATGVVLHTNLGRAPLSPAALARIADAGRYYTNLELDVRSKERGSRYAHVDPLLRRLSGAEASLVVNNNAAAVLLALESVAHGREVVVSRGELIEIGGAFRIPDIMARSGARLVEVGTTNRTRLADYRAAVGPETALLLKVHPSNYRVVGFTEGVTTAELASLGRERGIPMMEDLGSGCFVDLRRYGIAPEPTVPDTVAQGADLVTFSGDKLLGGPQAGIVVGRRALVERLARNPLNRALRIDKLTLAALEATLRAYEDPDRAITELPALRMLTEPASVVRRRAQRILRRVPAPARSALGLHLAADRSQVGGGALPLVELDTAVLALGSSDHSPEALDARLRARRPPVIGRVAGARLLLDCRTVGDDEVAVLVAALAACADGR